METRTVVEVLGKVSGVKPCSNEDFFMVFLNLPQEVFGKVFQVEEQSRPAVISILCDAERDRNLLALKPNHKYRFQLALGLQKGSTKDGKTYPDSVGYSILNATPVQ